MWSRPERPPISGHPAENVAMFLGGLQGVIALEAADRLGRLDRITDLCAGVFIDYAHRKAERRAYSKHQDQAELASKVLVLAGIWDEPKRAIGPSSRGTSVNRAERRRRRFSKRGAGA